MRSNRKADVVNFFCKFYLKYSVSNLSIAGRNHLISLGRVAERKSNRIKRTVNMMKCVEPRGLHSVNVFPLFAVGLSGRFDDSSCPDYSRMASYCLWALYIVVYTDNNTVGTTWAHSFCRKSILSRSTRTERVSVLSHRSSIPPAGDAVECRPQHCRSRKERASPDNCTDITSKLENH